MKLKFLLVITLAVACMAFEKDSKQEKDEFIRLSTLGNLWTYFANDMEYTIKCYNKIKPEYEKAIEKFEKQVKKNIDIMDHHYRDEKYNYYSRACFEELYKVAHSLFMFKSYINFNINDKNVREAIDYAKSIKKKIELHYKGYLEHKNFFYSRSYKETKFFYDYDKSSRGEFIESIRKYSEKFIRCGEGHRNLIQ